MGYLLEVGCRLTGPSWWSVLVIERALLRIRVYRKKRHWKSAGSFDERNTHTDGYDEVAKCALHLKLSRAETKK
jgi:hypothetical protein